MLAPAALVVQQIACPAVFVVNLRWTLYAASLGHSSCLGRAAAESHRQGSHWVTVVKKSPS